MKARVRKLGIGLGALVGLLIAALLLAPLFIDVNNYRARVLAEVKEVTGREAALDGPISLRLLPMPTVRAENIKVYNLPGSANSDMVTVRSVTVSPSLWALLGGRLKVSDVVLDEPKIVLAIDREGKPNWQLAPSPAEAGAGAPSPPVPLSAGRVTIKKGTFIFSDARAGVSITAEKADLTASVGSTDGPFSLAGSATVNGAPLRLELAVGPKGPSGHTAGLTFEAADGRLTFNGTLSELGPAAHVAGKATASAGNLVAFVDTLMKIAGRPRPVLPLLLGGRVGFAGTIEASQTSFAAKDVTLRLGEDTGFGSLSVALAPSVVVDATFKAKRLDFDKWLASLKLPAEVAAPAPTPPLDTAAQPAAPAPRSVLLSIDATVALEVEEVMYNKQPIRDLAIELRTRAGTVAVSRFNVVLPGDLKIEARSTMSGDAAKPVVEGEFSLQGSKLRETLTWLGADVSSVPPQKLQRVSMNGRLTSSGGNAEVKDAAFRLDDLAGSGGIVVAFTVPLAAVMHLEFASIDVNSYVPQRVGSWQGNTSSGIPILALLGPAVGLKVKIAKVVYRGETMASVDFDVARERGTLKLNDLRIANMAGARLAMRGAVAGYWEENPKADLVFSFDAPDMGRVLRLVGVGQAGLGAVSASGSIAGTFEQLVLREVALSALGWSGRASGTLSLPGAAKGPPQSAAYKGSIAINGQGIQARIDATLGERPHVDADLKAAVLDLATMRGSSSTPTPTVTSPSAAQAIDTAPMRSFDGVLHISAGTLAAPPLRLANADIAAGLKNGVLTLSHLTGELYGGTLNLAGTVDGSRPALRYEFHGQADGLPVGDMLRSTSGTNAFGSAINVAIDGRLNAHDIVARGGGSTTGELRSSMSGGAELGGYVRASADRFLQILGSAATGAVGGAIDVTLGNLGEPGRRQGRRRNRQSAECDLVGAAPIRQPRRCNLRPRRHRRRHPDSQRAIGSGPERHGARRHPDQPRQFDHQHHDLVFHCRGQLGPLPDHDGERSPVVAVVQRDARCGQGSARHRKADSRRQPHPAQESVVARAQHSGAAHPAAEHPQSLRPMRCPCA